jgi:phospholipase/carboxylesterase
MGEPEGALALFHGRGADEHDLFSLLDALDPERRLVGITVRGPLSLPPGGAHWYVVHVVGAPDLETFAPTYRRAAAFVDGLPALTGVPLARTVLGGFSQGTVMSWALALGPGRPQPAGVIALSGFMPDVPGYELDLEGREGFPVAIGHGTYDPVIGVEYGRQARDLAEAAGMSVLYRESPMAHTIDPGFLAELQPWLRRTVEGVAAG